MSNNSVIARNALFLSLRMVLVTFISIYTSRVFINVLGVVDYGISGVVGGFITVFSFLSPSFINGIQRFYNFEIGKERQGKGVSEVYTSALIIQTAWSFLLLLLLETIGIWYINAKMVIPPDRLYAANVLYQISMVSLVSGVMATPYSATVMAYERMDYYALVSIIDVVLKLAFAFAIPYVPIDKLVSFGLFGAFTSVLNFFMYFIYARRNFAAIRLTRTVKKKRIKEILTFSGWNMFGSFSLMARDQGVNIVLNLFFGPVVNAARSVASQMSGALQNLVQNLTVAVKPQMIQSHASGNSSRSLQLMYSMSKLSFIFMLALGIPIMFEVDFILNIWLGNAIPEHANTFIIWIILTNIVNNLHAQLSNMVFAIGKLKAYELTFSVLNFLILPLSYFALYIGGVPEVAFVIYFVIMVITMFVSLYILSRLMDFSISLYVKKVLYPILKVSVLSIILPVLVVYQMPQGWSRLLVTTFVCLAVALPVFYLTALDEKEKEMVNKGYKMIVRRIKKY